MYVEIDGLGLAAPTSSSIDKVTIDLVASSSGAISSFLGGNGLTFTGFGFGENIDIKVCGKPCTIKDIDTDLAYTSVTCDTPALISESTNTAYQISNIGLIHKQAEATINDYDSTTKSDKVIDDDVETYYTSNNELCYVGLDFGATSKAEIHLVRYFLKLGSDHESFLGSGIEGSDDGVTWTILDTQT